jgi:hypothetical protein
MDSHFQFGIEEELFLADADTRGGDGCQKRAAANAWEPILRTDARIGRRTPGSTISAAGASPHGLGPASRRVRAWHDHREAAPAFCVEVVPHQRVRRVELILQNEASRPALRTVVAIEAAERLKLKDAVFPRGVRHDDDTDGATLIAIMLMLMRSTRRANFRFVVEPVR